jgi:hypothetical protein
MCWGLLWVPVAARYGFLSEVLILEQLRGMKIGKRLEEILKSIHVEACGRYFAIASFAFLVSTVLFLFLDLGSQLLFGVPIFLAKVSWAVAYEDVMNLLSYDPLLVVALASTRWLSLFARAARLVLLLLDARIRREGWDVEIAFRVEARRIA